MTTDEALRNIVFTDGLVSGLRGGLVKNITKNAAFTVAGAAQASHLFPI